MSLQLQHRSRSKHPLASCSDAGDRAARALVKKLLQAGCQPYFGMLEQWLCEGALDDPFQEFMVCQDRASCPPDPTP